MSIESQLNEIEELEDGWYNGKCNSPAHLTETAKSLLYSLFENSTVTPLISPGDGIIDVEWKHKEFSYNIEINDQQIEIIRFTTNSSTTEKPESIIFPISQIITSNPFSSTTEEIKRFIF
jgi:hypothetical protein